MRNEFRCGCAGHLAGDVPAYVSGQNPVSQSVDFRLLYNGLRSIYETGIGLGAPLFPRRMVLEISKGGSQKVIRVLEKVLDRLRILR